MSGMARWMHLLIRHFQFQLYKALQSVQNYLIVKSGLGHTQSDTQLTVMTPTLNNYSPQRNLQFRRGPNYFIFQSGQKSPMI